MIIKKKRKTLMTGRGCVGKARDQVTQKRKKRVIMMRMTLTMMTMGV
jgi:hypothetical protein